MEKIESFKELLSLPVFYLVIAIISVFISLVSMPIVNHYAFGRCHDRDRGQEIANRIVKIQFFLVVIMIVTGITFVIGLCKSGDNFVPFF
jgi:hypothetical protein